MRPPRVLGPTRLSIILLTIILTLITYANSQTQRHLLCKQTGTQNCLLWLFNLEGDRISINGHTTTKIHHNCGLTEKRFVSSHGKFIKVRQIEKKEQSKKIFCNKMILIGRFFDWKEVENALDITTRVRRQSFTPRGRFRGQTQSQYLAVDRGNGKDEGRAEALSAADSSRASVSGNSGMGQAQSQSLYDPNCDDCYGKSNHEVENLKRPHGYKPGETGHAPNSGSTWPTLAQNGGYNPTDAQRYVPGQNIPDALGSVQEPGLHGLNTRPGQSSGTGPNGQGTIGSNNYRPNSAPNNGFYPYGNEGTQFRPGETPGNNAYGPAGSTDSRLPNRYEPNTNVIDNRYKPNDATGGLGPGRIPGSGDYRGKSPQEPGVLGPDGSSERSKYAPSIDTNGFRPSGSYGGRYIPDINSGTNYFPNQGHQQGDIQTSSGNSVPQTGSYRPGQTPNQFTPGESNGSERPGSSNTGYNPRQVDGNLASNLGNGATGNPVGFGTGQSGTPNTNWPIASGPYPVPGGNVYCCVIPNNGMTGYMYPNNFVAEKGTPVSGGLPGQPYGTNIPEVSGGINVPGGQYTPGVQYGPGTTGSTTVPGHYPPGNTGGTSGPGGQYGMTTYTNGQYIPTGNKILPGQYLPGSTGATTVPRNQYGPGSGSGSNVPREQYGPSGGSGSSVPGGQYGPGGGSGSSKPGGQYSPGGESGSAVPGGQYGPGGGSGSNVPGGQYGPGGGSGSNVPGGQYGPVEGSGSAVPGGPYGPGGSSGTSVSGGQYGPGGGSGSSVPGGYYGPHGGSGTSVPGGQYGPGGGSGSAIPGGQYGPGGDSGSTVPGGHYGPHGGSSVPGGQYGPGGGSGSTMPGVQYGPVGGSGSSVPGGQYRPGGGSGSSVPGSQYRPGGGSGLSVPGGQYGPGGESGSIVPGGQYGLGEGSGSSVPGGQYGPGGGSGSSIPGGHYGPGGSSGSYVPGGKYGPGGDSGPSVSGGQYGPGERSGSTVPGGQYGPGEGSSYSVPRGQYGPGASSGSSVPAGQYGPGGGSGSYVPGGQYGPGGGPGSSVPGGQYGPGGGTGSSVPGGQYGAGGGTGSPLPGGQYGPGGNGGPTLPGGQYTGGNVSPEGRYGTGSAYTPGAGVNQGKTPQGLYNQGGPTGENTDYNGVPQNYLDPNSVAADGDDSEAEANVAQNVNGTTASASSKGGNDKGRAQTSVQGTYTGSGSFQAQAQITGDNKDAQSEVSGGKKGASSSASGSGRNNKSQANVQLGSETGSVQTQSQSNGVMHSSNSQVQGSVKGGMADAQARGPGSTSSQAQIGFTPYKDQDKASHDLQRIPFMGGGMASAQSSGRTGQSQSQLHGTFKYGITYNGAAQSGASLDKDAVFPNRLSFEKIDVFDEKEKNINVDKINMDLTETPQSLDYEPPTPGSSTLSESSHIKEKAEIPTTENVIDESLKNSESRYSGVSNTDHQTPDSANATLSNGPTLLGSRRSFKPNYGPMPDYEFTTDKEETQPEYDTDVGYEGDGNEATDVEQSEYSNYDEYSRDSPTHQYLQNSNRKGLEVQQTTGGNTQHIILGALKDQNAEIIQKDTDRPDESRVYQPGERVPGTGGYTIPVGFTGSVKSVASKDKTYVVGSKEFPSQAQTVTLTPGKGKIKYTHPSTYGKYVKPKNLRSLQSSKENDNNRYVSVSKSVTRALDSDNNIRKQYSHTYYTKSSSCGYFTFTCTMVSSAEGRKKVCKPKMPTNPDGTPIRC